MNYRITAGVFLIGVLSCGVPLAGSAQDATLVQQYQGVNYVSGGVGEDERRTLEALGKEFNLKLMFALKSGQYLSDVSVRILNSQGTLVLTATSDGPLFYADLEPGSYSIEASGFGETYRQSVDISGRGQRQLDFFWPNSAAGS